MDLCMAHMAHRVVDMVDKGWDNVWVFASRGACECGGSKLC